MNPTLLDWLFAREVLRRLGFTPEELFFACYPSGVIVEDGVPVDLGAPIVSIEIRRGQLRFKWTIGTIDMTEAQIEAAFTAACHAWNAGDGPFSHAEFLASRPFQQAIPLMHALAAKGFTIKNPDTN